MIDPIEFEYRGVKVNVHVAWAGWEYEFDFAGNHYFASYRFSHWAEDGAKEKIRQLKLANKA